MSSFSSTGWSVPKKPVITQVFDLLFDFGKEVQITHQGMQRMTAKFLGEKFNREGLEINEEGERSWIAPGCLKIITERLEAQPVASAWERQNLEPGECQIDARFKNLE